ncbi:MAG: GWxTD domain-containing protein [bacterium]|nr:GWxTD domain-containing protein [bacterium]
MNVLLSPSLAQWLVGPVAHIAEAEEIEAYLRLADDQAAEAFIQEFWQKRVDPNNPWAGRQVKAIFDQRAEVADRLFTEGANLGRRTDRGLIYILFGAPRQSGFVQDERRRNTTVEIWLYDPKVRRGLDGSAPDERYYFTREDDVTVFTAAPRISAPVVRR